MGTEFLVIESEPVKVIDIRKLFVAYDLTSTDSEEGLVKFMVGALMGYHGGKVIEDDVNSVKFMELCQQAMSSPSSRTQPFLLGVVKMPITTTMEDFCAILKNKLIPVIKEAQQSLIETELKKTINFKDLVKSC